MTTQETITDALLRADLDQDELDIISPPSLEELIERSVFFRRYVNINAVGLDPEGKMWVKGSTIHLYKDADPLSRVRLSHRDGELTVDLPLNLSTELQSWRNLQVYEGLTYIRQYYRVLPIHHINIQKG